jgi:type VI protein secretion system component VasK
MPEVIVTRLLLFATPFAVWFVWREVARRTGRPMGATPAAWLVAAGGALVAFSLIATAIFHRDNRADTYVPAQTQADGRVQPGYFEKK